MKLLRLKINDDFRGVHKSFEIPFFDLKSNKDPFEFNPYCLVGRNGSGKSNILEALANIFYHLECIYLNNKPDRFEKTKRRQTGFDATVCSPNAFELEYLIPVSWAMVDKTFAEMEDTTWNDLKYAHIKVVKDVGKRPEIEIVNHKTFTNQGKKPDRIIAKQILPQLVIGYSSGENEVLSLPFFKMRFIHFDEYADILTKKFDYNTPEGRMLYVDNQYSQAILLSNFLMQDKKYLKPFTDIKEGIGILGVEQFRIIIQKHVYRKYKEEVLKTFPEEDLKDKSKINVELTTLIRTSIDKLIKCSTVHYESKHNEDSQNIILDFWVDDELKKIFKKEFISPLDLFRTFQVFHTLNLYDVSTSLKDDLYSSNSLFVNETVPILPSDKRVFRIKDFTVYKRGAKKAIYTKSLSDGEHQFLHTMGICLLLRDMNALFLFDEPETHFNPDWRSKFISTLKSCLKEDKNVLRDLLITTHSPFIVSDCQPENVLWFKRKDKIKLEEVNFNTFGASVNTLTLKLFEKQETISDLAKKEIEKLLTRFNNGEDVKQLIEEVTTEIGDSVEKILFINHMMENSKKG